jgi:hypothetical protein
MSVIVRRTLRQAAHARKAVLTNATIWTSPEYHEMKGIVSALTNSSETPMLSSCRLVALFSFAATMTAAAQAPGGPPSGPDVAGRTARGQRTSFLLARTGELQLTDAQVVRLAAIARRSEARRAALRASRDSLRSRVTAGQPQSDSAARIARRRMFEQARGTMERVREQERADLRDAIAVLTPDQQARAWEMVARGGRGGQMRGMRGERKRGDVRGERGMRPRRPRPGGPV